MRPLRWTYPRSYARLAAVAEQAGIHAYEFAARVEQGAQDAGTVVLAYQGKTWIHSARPDDWSTVSADVEAFFQAAVNAMAEIIQRDYTEFLHNREV